MSLLDVIEEEILHRDTVETAIREALEALRRPKMPDADHEADLRRQLSEIDTQLANVTGAVKLGGHLPSLVAEIRELERRRAALQQALKPAPMVATRHAVENVRRLIGEWREMFRENNITIARQILHTCLSERVTFTPSIKGARRAYEIRARLFTGKLTVG